MMDNFSNFMVMMIIQILVALCIFTVLGLIVRFIVPKIKSSSYFKSKELFNFEDYLPYEQVSELHQIFYLMMIVIFALTILYLIFYWKNISYVFIVLDIVLSLYLTIDIGLDSFKDKLILFLLIPFNSLNMVLFGLSYVFIFDYFHVLVYLYFIKVYFDKFMEYSETNSLGITILLLFIIVFVSFFITIVVEKVNPLDSLVMVSNAFTSNGYAILGKTNLGKINSLVLVWAGFILSGVGTATLATAIVMKHINSKFDELEDSVRRNREK